MNTSDRDLDRVQESGHTRLDTALNRDTKSGGVESASSASRIWKKTESQFLGRGQVLLSVKGTHDSSLAVHSSSIGRHVKRRRQSLLNSRSDSESPCLQRRKASPNITQRKARRYGKRSTVAAGSSHAFRMADCAATTEDTLSSGLPALNEESVADIASTSAEMSEDMISRSNETGGEEKRMALYSDVEAAPLSRWSCYEQESILMTPLKTLICEEDDEVADDAARCTGMEGSSLDGTARDIVADDSAEANPSVRLIEHIEYEAKSQLEPQQSTEADGKICETFCGGGHSRDAETSDDVLVPTGFAADVDAIERKESAMSEEVDRALNEGKAAVDDVRWQVEGVAASDFLKRPSQKPRKDEVERIESHMRAAGSVKKRRKQSKVSAVSSYPKQHTLRCRPKKKKISFKNVQVYYFQRSQGFTAVPTSGGVTLGMSAKHHDVKEFPIAEFEALMRDEQVKCSLARYRKRCAERAARFAIANEPIVPPFSPVQRQSPSCSMQSMNYDNGKQVLSEFTGDDRQIQLASTLADHEQSREGSSTDSTDEDQLSDEDEEDEFDEEEEELESSCYIMQPVGGRSRRAMLKAAGVQVDRSEAPICQSIRASRQHCGCTCANGVCLPETCECAKDGIKCQVDRASFPCPCVSTTCNNPEGRVEFNALRVRAHYLETMMRMKVLESSELTDPYRMCSPQHIRFQDSTHEASSYCNPPPPPVYQEMNVTESISQPVDYRPNELIGARRASLPEECFPSCSQRSQQEIDTPVTPFYDTSKRCRYDEPEMIIRADGDGDGSVDVAMESDSNRGTSVGTVEMMLNDAVANTEDHDFCCRQQVLKEVLKIYDIGYQLDQRQLKSGFTDAAK
ncbi:Cysteine/serine-rich nuclear protein 3 [Toxocara canis]|uniref:Cysteine/serine-rich nuclear protein 3 n=1 Tax=Toxocara canis TaxID=6265 RepID=A0A0B2W1Y2_TOXCA|nr:Cysteine/serine-rich nuclear protein 3 [Toxocara canis]